MTDARTTYFANHGAAVCFVRSKGFTESVGAPIGGGPAEHFCVPGALRNANGWPRETASVQPSGAYWSASTPDPVA